MTGAARIAIDLGAGSGRAMVGRFDGGTLSLVEARRFPNRGVRLPDGLYWDALGLFSELLSAVGELGARGAGIASVGIDSWGCDFGLIDRNGTLVSNPLHHRDGRGAAAMEEAFRRVPARELYETTGIQFLPFNTLFQLVALEGSPSLAAAETLLLIPDLLGYWLTGERIAEATNASTTGLLDVETGDWSTSLISSQGLRRELFPELRAPGAMVGPLLPDVAEATGLDPSTPLLAVASHDTASAVVAVPFEPGTRAAYISSGTWSLVGVELDAPVVSEEALAANLTNERGFGGTIRLLKNVMGLWLLQECRRTWLAEGSRATYDELVELARGAPPAGPLFDPDLPELMAPGDMPARIRAACVKAGQDVPSDRAVLVRAIFESLACKYRLVLELLERVVGAPIEVVHVIGGGARNAALCRLTADIARRPVLAGPVEGAALGNILVQLVAAGELGSAAEMREVVRSSVELVAYEPDGDAARWEALYDRFVHVVRPGLVPEGAAT